MAIVFHCGNCKKKVNAPNEAGGKWGKCPHCNLKCYIPLPKSDEEDDLTLAPVNAEEEAQYHQLMRETYHITEDLLHQIDESPEPESKTHSDEKQLVGMIVKYLRHMADGQIDAAIQVADKVAMYRVQAVKILEGMAVAEMQDEKLRDIPPKVLVGFIRNLLTKLS
ncbi:MAG: hypothetical protein K8R02_05505 [Anaerohalosphaeraceae bacterium]|nr:hypothetical protein [Anaerohalosphaeraceae bacterium]